MVIIKSNKKAHKNIKKNSTTLNLWTYSFKHNEKYDITAVK